MPCDDFQLAVLSSIVKKIKRVPLWHVLSLYGVEYDESDSFKKLHKKLKGYIVRLRKGKRTEARTEKRAESVAEVERQKDTSGYSKNMLLAWYPPII